MARLRDTWVYELKDGNEIVYYGITNDPDRRVIEQANSGKRFTHLRVISVALTRESAEERETEEIQRYQRQHGGRPPKCNRAKTY
jgi:predicted GIY-YIG superfamily endonuclease